MALSIQNIQEMMGGFSDAGYFCCKRPANPQNPVKIEWTDSDGIVRKFRLWVYEVTHGGGGRSVDEYRIQITNSPPSTDGLDNDGVTDLLMGFSPARRIVVAYDRRWLEKRMNKGEGSPSVQVQSVDIDRAQMQGIYRFTKNTRSFGDADIVTLRPDLLPSYLLDHYGILHGETDINQLIPHAKINKDSLWQYCLDRGFYFTPDILARYVASISTKPFVILSGVSGTGKSKMAEIVAEFYSTLRSDEHAQVHTPTVEVADKFVFEPRRGGVDKSRFALVPVRPDWIDNQSIIGFVNPVTGKYESTQALDLMLRADAAVTAAKEAASAPRFFMLLDEMNLARVEHYFSDWLACAESRRYQTDGSISQQPLPLHRHESASADMIDVISGDAVEFKVPSKLPIPTNLVITGTVNVDETTFGFSPKVLDRSMVIEFNDVDLDGLRNGAWVTDTEGYRFPEVLPPFRLATTEEFKALPINTHAHLVAINRILAESQLHFGYRSAAEIGLFISIYNDILPINTDDVDMLRALDVAILQKVLPRIQGNRARIERTLGLLLYYLRDLDEPENKEAVEEMKLGDEAKLTQSYLRGWEMLNRLRDFGFVTFFK